MYLLNDSKALRFGHKGHLDEGLECADCHTSDQRQVGMPVLNTCYECHDIPTAAGKQDQTLGKFIGESGKASWIKRYSFSDEINFDHLKHAPTDDSCISCHKGIVEDRGKTEEKGRTKEHCQNCHKERGISNDCALCHKVIRADSPPASHNALFTILLAVTISPECVMRRRRRIRPYYFMAKRTIFRRPLFFMALEAIFLCSAFCFGFSFICDDSLMAAFT